MEPSAQSEERRPRGISAARSPGSCAQSTSPTRGGSVRTTGAGAETPSARTSSTGRATPTTRRPLLSACAGATPSPISRLELEACGRCDKRPRSITSPLEPFPSGVSAPFSSAQGMCEGRGAFRMSAWLREGSALGSFSTSSSLFPFTRHGAFDPGREPSEQHRRWALALRARAVVAGCRGA